MMNAIIPVMICIALKICGEYHDNEFDIDVADDGTARADLYAVG